MTSPPETRRFTPPTLDAFPLRTHEKLRYADTDRQGHINNAVFATMLETGRVELLYNSERPLAEPGCSFVIARLVLDFLAEIKWPGRVDIGTRIAAIGRSSTTLDQALFQEGNCVATATTVIVNINGAGRGQPFSDCALETLKSYLPAGSQ
ncbi:MAG: acyl-CoA thioesterase [Defluviicoccus sp.]|nr:acyl-CoA thioesterase [Defluviicoccus sp.]MDG4608244.1 acyl-CoA thioesterase [Defluviicoccus sp.]